MDIINKPGEYDDSSSFICLPDDVLLQVISNLSDLKTLCLCKLVSKRFHRIVLQVETISFTDPLLETPYLEYDTSAPDAWFGSFPSVISSLNEFKRVKSLFIQFPCSHADNGLLFKWKINFGNKVDSFIFLSPNSVYQNKELNVDANVHEEEFTELWKNKFPIAMRCLDHVTMRIILLLHYIGLPCLEKVSFTDSGKRGKVSINGKNFAEARNELYPPARTVGEKVQLELKCARLSNGYIGLLKLPVSGYVMKGVTIFLMERKDIPDNDWLLKTADDLDNFEDEEEAAYSEAMKVIFKKIRGGTDAEVTRIEL